MGKKTIGATQCAAFLPTGERSPAAIPGNGKARAATRAGKRNNAIFH